MLNVETLPVGIHASTRAVLWTRESRNGTFSLADVERVANERGRRQRAGSGAAA
jgi:hypothetical protein